MSSPTTPIPAEAVSPIYRFGQFELHSGSGELFRNGSKQRLAEQPFLVLLTLLEKPEEIVSREALCERLWPQNTFVDFELGLNAAMKRLRRVLRDDAANPRFIETVPKRGYRLLVPVVVVSAESQDGDNTLAAQGVEGGTIPSENSPEKAAFPQWITWGVVAAAVFIALGVTCISLWKPQPVHKVRRYSIVLSQEAPLAPASLMPLGVGRPNVAISRDGELVIYVGVMDATTKLLVRDHSGNPPRVLSGTEGAHSPFLSPDGKWIGFFAEGKLKKIPVSGGPAIVLCDVALGFGGYWAEDDTIYFTPGERTTIYRIPALGGMPTQVVLAKDRVKFLAMYWPQLLPGGKGLVFGISRGGIGVLDLKRNISVIVARGGSSPRWSPTGHILYVDNGVLWALPFDLKRMEKTGAPILLTDQVRMELQGAAQYDISQDGALVYAQGGDVAEASLVWLDAEGREESIGLPPKHLGEFKLSPEGKRLAIIIQNGVVDDLWCFDLERKILTRLTDEGRVWSPIWSPDGKKIVYATNSSGKAEIVELSLDARQRRVLATIPGLEHLNSYTPDGHRIVLSRQSESDHVVALLDSATGNLQVLNSSPYILAFPSISPDGRWLAYVSDDTGRWEIYLRSMEKGNATSRVTSEGGEEPIWDREGHSLYYRNGDKWMKSQVLSADGSFKASTPVQLVQGPYINIPGYSYDMAANGHFLLLRSEYQEKRSKELEVIENWTALLH